MKNYTNKSPTIISQLIHFAAVAAFVVFLIPVNVYAQATQVNLGSASSFAVLAAAGITNTGATHLWGDIGSYPTATITGFGTGTGTYSGTNHGGDAVTQSAMLALNAAYLSAAGRTGAITVGTELGGTTLTSGVYTSGAGTFTITGTLTLNAENNPGAVFIFQMATTLTTAVSSSVVLINGASWENVYWQVGSSATLGSTSIFEGTILANTSITSNGATMNGRLLAGAVTVSGAVVLNNDQVLPVELISFTASVLKNIVELNWKTETEVNNFGFEIQRSSTSNLESVKQNYSWTKVGFVQGAGNSNSPKQYAFVDKTVSYGRFAYRLKQLDTDGDFEFSQVIEIFTGQMPNGFLLHQNYPNPFNPSTLIQFGVNKNTFATLIVYNAIGEMVEVLFNGNVLAGQIFSATFDGENHQSGIYFYKLQTNERKEVKKMLLLK